MRLESELGRWKQCHTVPKIVPSGRLDVLSWGLGRSAESRIFTSESQRIQNALKC